MNFENCLCHNLGGQFQSEISQCALRNVRINKQITKKKPNHWDNSFEGNDCYLDL